jgi:hypothetical protein
MQLAGTISGANCITRAQGEIESTTSFSCLFTRQMPRCFFPLTALVAIIGAQQSPPVAPLSSAAPFDDLAVAEQDFVNPLSRNLALGGALFDQFAADAGSNLQTGMKDLAWKL